MKKVLLFLIDSMMSDVLQQCIAAKKAPAFQFFMERGEFIKDCVTVFPTMTASVDCSLITGVYPDQHKIPGLIWFDPSERKMINYINGALPIYEIGIDRCVNNVLFDLNERHLSKDVKTIHEELEEKGLISGSINVIAHRGHKAHKIELPFLVDAITKFKTRKKISGPSILSLGTLVRPGLFRPIVWNWAQAMPSSFGINDAYAIDVLIEVIRSGKQPDFTLVYLPDNDHKLHTSFDQAVDHLAAVDQQLVRFLDSFDSWEQVLERNVCLFISDHGQTLIGSGQEHNIPLEQLLSRFAIHKLGTEVSPNDEIVLCNNERMTYLYPLSDGLLPLIVDALADEAKIDLIAWKEREWVTVVNGGTKRQMKFRKGGENRDVYGQNWTVEGDLQVLDLRIDQGGIISFDQYPDCLSRLYGALYSQEIPVIVLTAAPGYEFLSECAPTHLGSGSHGSLHKQDSTIPLLVAGSSRPFQRPARLIDVKEFILQELAAESVLV